jgi:hypothetical protein
MTNTRLKSGTKTTATQARSESHSHRVSTFMRQRPLYPYLDAPKAKSDAVSMTRLQSQKLATSYRLAPTELPIKVTYKSSNLLNDML